MDVKEACEICGYVSDLGTISQHHVIPKIITERAGIPEPVMISLCPNCHFELNAWYKTKVTDIVYDPETKRFRSLSWDEMIKEHRSAFNDFRKYKDKQRKIH